jgi:hypothetical protein
LHRFLFSARARAKPRKPDDEAIADFLDRLASEPWLDVGRKAWPSYVFHLTDVHNAVSIVATGRLLSRSRVQRAGLMYTENASTRVIAQTPQAIQDYVRFYFRPRTPTFHRNEGIRPIGQRELNAHCPMPVAFLFDAKYVLRMEGTRFSDGSLASGRARIGDDVSFLRQMPFPTIYHNTWFTPDERDEIVFRRQAEVIVPEQISLVGLRHVVARSIAEYETFFTLLEREERVTPSVLGTLLSIARVNSRDLLFHKKWTYIERVDVIQHSIRLTFNPSTETPGPFTATFSCESKTSGEILTDTVTNFYARAPHWYSIPASFREDPFWFTLQLDGCLAYSGELDVSPADELLDVPF